MGSPGSDAILWGVTTAGRTFRPSDWAERLAGLTHAFGLSGHLTYSPLVQPVRVAGVRALIVGAELETLEPRLYQFLLNFARDNELVVTHAAQAMQSPHRLQPPALARPSGGEPREPV